MMKSGTIRVAIADDHAILRTGLRMLIDSQHDMKVIAEAQDGNEIIQIVGRTQPDVVVLDITMPNSGGLSVIPEVLKKNASSRILLLTMHDEAAYLRTALAAGASGYVLKRSVDADLLSAIRAVYKGRTYVDSELAAGLLSDAAPRQHGESSMETRLLSERELQVLKLVAEGFSSREIAAQIFVSIKTVETYRGRFAEKLGLKSRADIVRYALDAGLLSPEKFSLPKRNGRKAASPPKR